MLPISVMGVKGGFFNLDYWLMRYCSHIIYINERAEIEDKGGQLGLLRDSPKGIPDKLFGVFTFSVDEIPKSLPKSKGKSLVILKLR